MHSWILFILSGMIIGFSILGLYSSFVLDSAQISFWSQNLNRFFFLFYLFCSILGFFSLFIKKYQTLFRKIFGLSLMILFFYFPFSLLLNIYISILIYSLSTIGIVLFLKNK